jgi:hypothetical protein
MAVAACKDAQMPSPDRRVAPQAATRASKSILGLLKIVEQRDDGISKV